MFLCVESLECRHFGGHFLNLTLNKTRCRLSYLILLITSFHLRVLENITFISPLCLKSFNTNLAPNCSIVLKQRSFMREPNPMPIYICWTMTLELLSLKAVLPVLFSHCRCEGKCSTPLEIVRPIVQ